MNPIRLFIYLLFFSYFPVFAGDSGGELRKDDQHFVEFLGGFNGEKVKLYLDGQLVFSGALYTKDSNMLAKSIEIKSKKQRVILKVEVSALNSKKENNPAVQTHRSLMQSIDVDWSKGFLVTFQINVDNQLQMQQSSKWPERY